MRLHYLNVIPGGLRSGETVRSKLLTRPHDFPEEIFKRLHTEAGGDLDISTIVDIWDRRDAGIKARGNPRTNLEGKELPCRKATRTFLHSCGTREDCPRQPGNRSNPV